MPDDKQTSDRIGEAAGDAAAKHAAGLVARLGAWAREKGGIANALLGWLR